MHTAAYASIYFVKKTYFMPDRGSPVSYDDAMQVLQLDNVRVTLDREGARTYTKASYPIRYGRYAEIDYEGYVFQYNLNGEIKHIGSTGPDWPHPAEWLKRTIANDWVYYSTGSYYTGTADLFGEFYMPCHVRKDHIGHCRYNHRSDGQAIQTIGEVDRIGRSHNHQCGK